MRKRILFLVLALVAVFIIAQVATANDSPNIPRRLQVDDTEQRFIDQATPTSYTVPCRGACVGIDWYAKHPNHTRKNFDKNGLARTAAYVQARGSVCPNGAQGWSFNKTFKSWSLVSGGLRHVLASANMEIVWCTKNGDVVRGSAHAIPTNHCGKGTVDTVYDYDSCSIDRGTLYLSKLHVWEEFRYHYDLRILTLRLVPQLDFHVYSDGRISGVYDPG